jgi:hypothetical protein
MENTNHAVRLGLIDFSKRKNSKLFKGLRKEALMDLRNIGYTQDDLAEIFCCTQASVSENLRK